MPHIPPDCLPEDALALRGPRSRTEAEGRAVLSLALGVALLVHAGFMIAVWTAPEPPKKRDETRERVIDTLRVADVRVEIPKPRDVPPAPPLLLSERVELAEILPASIEEAPAGGEPEVVVRDIVESALPDILEPDVVRPKLTMLAALDPPDPAPLYEPPPETPDPDLSTDDPASASAEPLPSPAAVPTPELPTVTTAPVKPDKPPRKPSKRGESKRRAARNSALIKMIGSASELDNMASLSVIGGGSIEDALGGGIDSALTDAIAGGTIGGVIGRSGRGSGLAIGGPGEGIGAIDTGGIALGELTGSAELSAFDEDAVLATYIRRVTGVLARHKVYPQTAARRRIEGTVTLELVIDADGRIVERRLARSSGHDVLDEAAMDAVRKVSTVPKPPASLSWKTRAIRVPFKYTLR